MTRVQSDHPKGPPMPSQFPVPDGWLPFGSLVDYDGPAECSEEVGEDGLPLWERPIPPDVGNV